MRPIRYLLLAALLGGGCKPAAGPELAKTPPPIAVEAPKPTAPAVAPLTAEGWGLIKVGSREPDAMKTGVLIGTAPPHDEDWIACHELKVTGQPDLYVMVEEEELTRLTITGASKLLTDKGLGLGATADQVKAAYGRAIKVAPHKYEAAPAGYLTAWDAKTERGVRYETNDKGLVSAIHVGAGSIELVEGCS